MGELDGVNEWNAQVIAEFRANGGKVAGEFGLTSMILVHHRGARSGVERVSPVVAFPDGDRMLIVASAAGSPKNPDWYHNVKAHPLVDVEMGTETFRAVAEELPPEERDRKWTQLTEMSPRFAAYQEKTSRMIPVLSLTRM